MSHPEQQAGDATTESQTDTDSWDLTTELWVIGAIWLGAALLGGVGFVVFSDVFLGLV